MKRIDDVDELDISTRFKKTISYELFPILALSKARRASGTVS